MHCRPMLLEDLDQIMLLGNQAEEFYVTDEDHFWGTDHIKQWINSSQDLAIVAIDNELIVGFLLASYHESSKKVTLENIYVCENHRQKGVGKMLMHELLMYAQNLHAAYLAALTSGANSRMDILLKKYGFSKGHVFHWYGKRLD